jgi:hypothetical protein
MESHKIPWFQTTNQLITGMKGPSLLPSALLHLWLRINGFLPVQDDQLPTVPMGPLKVEPRLPWSPSGPGSMLFFKNQMRANQDNFHGDVFFL